MKLKVISKKFISVISFKKMVIFFIIFGFIGCLYEEVITMIIRYIRSGNLYFVTKRGLLYFEIAPIYGIGACLMIYILTRRNFRKFDYFWIGAIIGGVFEYLVSYIQEIFTGTFSWNYSNYFLNIDGRTTIPFMLIWGLLCYILMVYIYPYISKFVDKFLNIIGNTGYYIIFIIIILDIFISFSACIRMGYRHDGYEPLTFYGEFLDRVYDDERMKKSYTNMKDK